MKYAAIVEITILLVTRVNLLRGQGQCNARADVWAGINTTVSGTDHGAPSGTTFILREQGSVNCFGVVAEWRAVVNTTCVGLQIDFGVWRIVSSNVYELVGYNSFIDDDCVDIGFIDTNARLITLKIPENARIPVEDTNVLGWHFRGGRSLYTTTNDGPVGTVVVPSNCDGQSTGSTCSAGPVQQVDYQMMARLEPGPSPTIDNLDNSIDIFEGEPADTRIFTVLASHPSSQARETDGSPIVDPAKAVLFTFANSSTAEFTFMPEADKIGRLFINTAMSFDYETRVQYLLFVSVTAMAQTATGTLTVNILDKNERHYYLNLPSNTSASAMDPTCQTDPIYTVMYGDVDDPTKFPAKKLYIFSSVPLPPSGSNLPFVINEDTGEVFCTSELSTWTTAMGRSFRLRIHVSDGMHNVPSYLTVNIQQTHDPPRIVNLPATHLVLEDLTVPSIIYRVVASGPLPAFIRFSIEDVAPRKYFYYFSIDPTSGDISLTSTAVLDYNLQRPSPSFTVTIGVRDNLQSGISANLMVDLIWVNQKPVYSPNEYFVTVAEHCNSDNVCTTTIPFEWPIPNLLLNIIDRDVDNSLPNNAAADVLSCGILPSFGSGFFKYPSDSAADNCGTLYQQYSIDIDDSPQNRQINLTVWVKDTKGVVDNDKGDVAHIYITITDINDNFPVFVNVPSGAPPYTATIPENTPGGVSLFTVTATDKDSDVFGEVTYSLRDESYCDTPPPLIPIDATQHFEVDEITGLVRTKQYVNYESINPKRVCFSLVATDGGGKSTLIQASVEITNLNDVRPIWHCDNATLRDFNDEYQLDAPCFYDEELRSDILLDYLVLTILSTDDDTPGSDITYHLLQQNRFFSLGGVTGEIRVKDYLDAYVKHILYCYSRDNGSPNLQSQPQLRVRIDTYDAKRQLVDIVMEIQETQFDQSQQRVFLQELRKIIYPWFPKIEIVGSYKDKTKVSIYALRNNSTFNEKNLPRAKQFVDRNELLKMLRKNIYGSPRASLKTPAFDSFGVILVEPTYPVWIIDTVPGIITLAIICLLLIGGILGLILGLCKRYSKCCFKKRPHMNRNWPEKKASKPDDRLHRAEEKQRHQLRRRMGSTDTIHSLIYNPQRAADD